MGPALFMTTRSDQEVQECRTALWIDAEAIRIGRNRRYPVAALCAEKHVTGWRDMGANVQPAA
jgi:hypothetical protein